MIFESTSAALSVWLVKVGKVKTDKATAKAVIPKRRDIGSPLGAHLHQFSFAKGKEQDQDQTRMTPGESWLEGPLEALKG